MRSRLPEDTSEASDRLSPHWLVFARCGTIPSGTELKTSKAIPPWRCTPPCPDWTSSRTLERGGAGIRPRRRRHHHTKGFPAYQHVQRRARGRELSASLSVLRRPGCALSRSRGRG